jgi:hypothetical protein
MANTPENIRKWLCDRVLHLDEMEDATGIFGAVDAFVEVSQGNTTVKKVIIYPYDEDPGNYELWDKVGRGVGNLESLSTLSIFINNVFDEADEPNPDWEILARNFRHVSHDIKLDFCHGFIAGAEDMRAFATAIQGHPAITRFVTSRFHDTRGSFHFETTDILCSALTTLPNLEHVSLHHLAQGREEVPELGHPESVTELLRAPSLRSVVFQCFCFTNALCEATANALKEGSAITSLKFVEFSFPDGGSEKIASALKKECNVDTFLYSFRQ